MLTTAVDRTLGEGRRGEFLGTRFFEPDLHPVGNALDLLDDRVGEWIGILPERLELLLDPCYALRRGVFPENLVVLRRGARVGGCAPKVPSLMPPAAVAELRAELLCSDSGELSGGCVLYQRVGCLTLWLLVKLAS